MPTKEEEVQRLLIKETTTKGGREVITITFKETIILITKETREIMHLHRARVILVVVLILHRLELMGKVADIVAMELEHLIVKDRVMDLTQALLKVKDFHKVIKETHKKKNETTLLVDKHGMTKEDSEAVEYLIF